MEALLKPLQKDATSGVGKTLIIPDPARIVRFLIRSKGSPTGGEITFECCPMDTGQAPKVSAGMVWRTMKTVPVPTDIGVVTGYYAGKASGMFRARISTPIAGGTVTVWPFVGNTKAALKPVVR
jgi:hypothetical protein